MPSFDAGSSVCGCATPGATRPPKRGARRPYRSEEPAPRLPRQRQRRQRNGAAAAAPGARRCVPRRCCCCVPVRCVQPLHVAEPWREIARDVGTAGLNLGANRREITRDGARWREVARGGARWREVARGGARWREAVRTCASTAGCQAWGEGPERLPIRPYPDSMLYSKGLYLLPPPHLLVDYS